jgi:hypothetical protein
MVQEKKMCKDGAIWGEEPDIQRPKSGEAASTVRAGHLGIHANITKKRTCTNVVVFDVMQRSVEGENTSSDLSPLLSPRFLS